MVEKDSRHARSDCLRLRSATAEERVYNCLGCTMTCLNWDGRRTAWVCMRAHRKGIVRPGESDDPHTSYFRRAPVCRLSLSRTTRAHTRTNPTMTSEPETFVGKVSE